MLGASDSRCEVPVDCRIGPLWRGLDAAAIAADGGSAPRAVGGDTHELQAPEDAGKMRCGVERLGKAVGAAR